MRKAPASLCTEDFSAQREWTVEGIPVLSASLTLPRPVCSDTRTARRIERYYRAMQRSYLAYCEHLLFPRSAEAAQAAIRSSMPLPHDSAVLNYQITWNRDGIWSLYIQSRESLDGRRAELLRRGDTWDLLTGYPLALSEFFPRRSAWRKQLRSFAAQEIRRQEADGTACYQDGWPRRLRHFNSENFYLCEEGLCFFYPMYALAPPAEGIPVFCLPFAPEGPRLPGRT